MKAADGRYVIHVIRTPSTGVWSFVTNLLAWQNERYEGRVGFGVIADRTWPASYREKFEALPYQKFLADRPFYLNGTLSYLAQTFTSPLSGWLRELERDHHPEKLVLHFHNAWLAGVFHPLPKRSFPITSVVTFHGVADQEKLRRRRWQANIHAWMAQRLNRKEEPVRLVSVDKPNTKVCEELFGLPAELFSVVPTAVPTTEKRGCPRLAGSEVFTVGYAGQMVDGKGWHQLALACQKLFERGKPIRLLLAGIGTEEEKARHFAVENSGFVRYLGYVADARDNVFPQLDAFALPSVTEGMPMSLLEALSLGIPILATPVGGIPSCLADGINGFFISRDVDDIANKLERLIDDRSLHARFAASALAGFQHRFSIDAVGELYDNIYWS